MIRKEVVQVHSLSVELLRSVKHHTVKRLYILKYLLFPIIFFYHLFIYSSLNFVSKYVHTTRKRKLNSLGDSST